jgi:hypothetical protein
LHFIVPNYVVSEPLNGTHIPILPAFGLFDRRLFPMCFHACELKVLDRIDQSDTDAIIDVVTQYLDEMPNVG